MFYRILNENLKLVLTTTLLSEDIYKLIDLNREYLKKWLPWLDNSNKPEDTKNFIETCINGFSKMEQLHCTILYKDSIVGVVGFNSINWTTKTGYIGYWLSEKETGKGIMTTAVKEIEKIGFTDLKLEKTEISCAHENSRSRGIPERLGYKNEGIIRKAENLYDLIVDHVVYGLLKDEYFKRQGMETT